ncbi:MAG: hypothetical protein KBC43_01685 [Bacteroidales bacterium]|nr:hypothetical protein [Bacteroidales bacterium]
MNRFLFLLLILFISSGLYAQQKSLPSNKYKDRITLGEIQEKMKECNGFTISYGYHQTVFLNPRFDANMDNGILERKYGGVFRVSYMLHPVIFDVDWFSSRFRIHDSGNWALEDTTDVRHRGLSLFISTTLFPLVHTRAFIPYIGIGYQTSSLGANINLISFSSGKDESQVISLNTSSPLWKIGLTTRIWQALVINIEYRQAFLTKEKKGYNELGIMLGIDYSVVK